MINKEQHVFLCNLGLIALMNGMIALWASPHAINSHSLVLLIPNCTQNHAVTYTCHMELPIQMGLRSC